jgi:hypothetical protein
LRRCRCIKPGGERAPRSAASSTVSSTLDYVADYGGDYISAPREDIISDP